MSPQGSEMMKPTNFIPDILEEETDGLYPLIS